MTRWQRFVHHPFSRLGIIIGIGFLLSVIMYLVIFAVSAFTYRLPNNLAELPLALGFFLAVVIVNRQIEKQPLAVSGMPTRGIIRDLVVGFAGGGALFTIVFTILYLGGWYRFDGAGSGGLGALGSGLVMFFIGASFEELLFRSALFRLIEEGVGSAIAILASGAFFGFSHIFNPNATIWSALAIALEAGVVFALLYMVTRSIWVCIGLHWAWNTFEGSFFGTPVSGLNIDGSLFHSTPTGPAILTGGAFGPEAGLVSIAVLSLFGVYLLWRANREHQFIAPPWVQHKPRPVVAPASE